MTKALKDENEQLKQRIAALEQKLQTLDCVLTNIDAFVYMKDKDFCYQYVNLESSEIYGDAVNSVIGKKDSDLLPPALVEQFRKLDEHVFSTGEKQVGEEKIVGPDGKPRYYWFNNIPLKDEQGRVDRYIGFSTDITQLSQLRNNLQEQVEEEINRRQQQEHLATTDKLTKLNNRAKLDQELANQVHQAQLFGECFGMLILDLDNFKIVNDTHGHQVGDSVLVEVANMLKKNVRQIDILGRWGGEEFMILCPDTKPAGLMILAEKIRAKVELHTFPVVKHKTTSIGVSFFEQTDTLDSIIAKADSALYKAKNKGRNRAEFWELEPKDT